MKLYRGNLQPSFGGKSGDYFIFGVMNQIPSSTPKIIAKAIQSASRYCLRDLTAKSFVR